MIDGVTSKAFSATTLPPRPIPEKIFTDVIIEFTRLKYCRPRIEVEKMISQQWAETNGENTIRDVSGQKLETKKKMYADFCWVCGKEVEIPFEPDGKRPVYCKDCLKDVTSGKIPAPTKPLKLETNIVRNALTEKKNKPKQKPQIEKSKAKIDVDELKKALRESLSKLDNSEGEKKE